MAIETEEYELPLPHVSSHPHSKCEPWLWQKEIHRAPTHTASVSLGFGKRRLLGLPPFPDVYQAPPAETLCCVMDGHTEKRCSGGAAAQRELPVPETL